MSLAAVPVKSWGLWGGISMDWPYLSNTCLRCSINLRSRKFEYQVNFLACSSNHCKFSQHNIARSFTLPSHHNASWCHYIVFNRPVQLFPLLNDLVLMLMCPLAVPLAGTAWALWTVYHCQAALHCFFWNHSIITSIKCVSEVRFVSSRSPHTSESLWHPATKTSNK